DVQHAAQRARGGRAAPSAPTERGGIARGRPGHDARMLRDHGRWPHGPDAIARDEALQPPLMREVTHAVPEARVQIGAGLELDPGAPEALDEDRRARTPRADAVDDRAPPSA